MFVVNTNQYRAGNWRGVAALGDATPLVRVNGQSTVSPLEAGDADDAPTRRLLSHSSGGDLQSLELQNEFHDSPPFVTRWGPGEGWSAAEERQDGICVVKRRVQREQDAR